MGAPYNQLQQLTGLAPTRAIGVGHLKNYFADIAKPNLALNWNTQIKQIDFEILDLKSIRKKKRRFICPFGVKGFFLLNFSFQPVVLEDFRKKINLLQIWSVMAKKVHFCFFH